MSRLNDPEYVAVLRTDEWPSSIGARYGISRHAVKRDRAKLGERRENPTTGPVIAGESETHRPDGSADYVLNSEQAWGYSDFCRFIESKGQNPDEVTFTWGVTTNPSGGFWNKLNNVRPKVAGKDDGAPEWPVIQPAERVQFVTGWVPPKPARDGLKLSLKCADTQIGFRAGGNTIEAFHDWTAINVFIAVCRAEQPDSIIILGDFLDLAAQGKYVQEAGFARTTQMALNDGHLMLSLLRAACPNSQIVLVEGNHDKRMQSFIEQNALAAFGLKQANMPDSWPVMSLPNLLRMGELNIDYMDAYPAAAHWDDDTTRNIHGTRANSRGSTMAQYVQDAPHINTWAGHTHRTEIIYKTVIGPRGEPIETYSANPGALCHTDGRVPSVHGAIHADGSSARVVEDWQQGFGSLLHGDGVAWPQVHRIRDGVTVYNGKRFTVEHMGVHA
ncbi:metallophosphoesterase [Leucobacter rhizosphaerae]|uniref:Metallophosphoesterase n=1 Tax=Leucobacter rhizosphaerae TaxID=2932245 RepID=A0ABY4FVR6_9MICO|nr:metallophosphoesterase [Leucobacter rhizosphaerae]UOQ60372.1 metallophosphoesterase [Leucobacter rhizosphaerae]